MRMVKVNVNGMLIVNGNQHLYYMGFLTFQQQ